MSASDPVTDRYRRTSVVGAIEPVLPDRAEDVELEGVLERFGLVLDPRRNVQHFAFAHA